MRKAATRKARKRGKSIHATGAAATRIIKRESFWKCARFRRGFRHGFRSVFAGPFDNYFVGPYQRRGRWRACRISRCAGPRGPRHSCVIKFNAWNCLIASAGGPRPSASLPASGVRGWSVDLRQKRATDVSLRGEWGAPHCGAGLQQNAEKKAQKYVQI